jgi:Tfp pilus assembly protein PilF
MIIKLTNSWIQRPLFTLLLLVVIVFYCTNTIAQTVDPKLYKRLSDISELLGKKNNELALKRLEPLLRYAKKDSYEGALVNQMAGYVYMSTGKPEKAIDHFKTSIASKKLPNQLNQDIRLILTQLLLSKSRTAEAEQQYEVWLKNADKIKPSDYALGGSIYIASKNYNKAEQFLAKATKDPAKAKESWFKLLLYAYYESKNYKKAKDVLLHLVSINPGSIDYWRRLSDVYYELGDTGDALAVMQIAYQQNLVTKKGDLLRLTSLLSQQNLYKNSGDILNISFKNKEIEPSPDLVNALYNSYYSAREMNYAAQELVKYSDASKQPNLFIQAAYQYIEDEDWTKAEKLLLQVNKTNKTFPEAYLGMAIVKINQKDYKDANKWLDKSIKFKSTEKSAMQWRNYLKNVNKDNNNGVTN